MKEWPILELHETISVQHVVACPIVFISFYDRGRQRGALKLMKNDHFFSICRRLGHFPQVFGQAKEWVILKLHEMIRVLHVVAWPMDYNLLYDQGQQLGVLKMFLF